MKKMQRLHPYRASCISQPAIVRPGCCVQVIAEHGAEFSLASLKAMTYLEAVMKETQRRYPIVGGVFRKALRSFELPGRYHIPKVGQTLAAAVHYAVAHAWLRVLSSVSCVQ